MEIDLKKVIKDLITEYPNDYDLGSKVRELIRGMEKIKKNVIQKEGIEKK